MRYTRPLVIALVLGAFATAGAAPAPAAPESPRIVGYYASWAAAGGYPAEKIPAAKLTHVNYAFAVIRDGRCALRNETAAREQFEQLRRLKRDHPHLRTLISVGGWADSGPFSDVALNDSSRLAFARSCAAFVREHGLDGVDIDWEYPGGGGRDPGKGRPEDSRNFTLLLAELRRQLDTQSREDKSGHYLLTIAGPASAAQARRMELGQVHRYLDWINLMTYDFAGQWSARTAFNAPLYPADEAGQGPSADTSVRVYLDAGVPREKLLLGVPFYGRAWAGVKDVDHGLGQPHSGKPPRPPGGAGYSYRNIASGILGESAGRFWHERAKVPWLFDAKAGVMVSYDDPESIRAKARYAREQKLGGVMVWELSEDDEKSSLLEAIRAGWEQGR